MQPGDYVTTDGSSITWSGIGNYTVFQKKTPTHIVGYKLRNSCLILIIFDIKIPDIIWHRTTA